MAGGYGASMCYALLFANAFKISCFVIVAGGYGASACYALLFANVFTFSCLVIVAGGYGASSSTCSRIPVRMLLEVGELFFLIAPRCPGTR